MKNYVFWLLPLFLIVSSSTDAEDFLGVPIIFQGKTINSSYCTKVAGQIINLNGWFYHYIKRVYYIFRVPVISGNILFLVYKSKVLDMSLYSSL